MLLRTKKHKIYKVSLFLDFFFGFSTSFLGMVFPSMLNLTSVKINQERGKKNATQFAIGVGITVLFQAYLAVYLMEHIKENPEVLAYIRFVASILFAGLTVYFFKYARPSDTLEKPATESFRNTFVVGVMLSAMNMFAIPFYYGVISLLHHLELLMLEKENLFLFILGSALGSFLLLYLYPKLFSRLIKVNRVSTHRFNLALGILTAGLTIISLIQLI